MESGVPSTRGVLVCCNSSSFTMAELFQDFGPTRLVQTKGLGFSLFVLDEVFDGLDKFLDDW